MTSYRDPLKGIETQRPTQRNMGPDTETQRNMEPDTETRSKEHGTRHPDSDIIERPAQRNMGPDTETHSKEHGTRHRDPLKGTWDEASRQ